MTKKSLLSLDIKTKIVQHMKTKVVVTVTETVTDTFGSQLLSKTFDIFNVAIIFEDTNLQDVF